MRNRFVPFFSVQQLITNHFGGIADNIENGPDGLQANFHGGYRIKFFCGAENSEIWFPCRKRRGAEQVHAVIYIFNKTELVTKTCKKQFNVSSLKCLLTTEPIIFSRLKTNKTLTVKYFKVEHKIFQKGWISVAALLLP